MHTGKVMGADCSNLLGLQGKDLDVHGEKHMLCELPEGPFFSDSFKC